MRFALEGSFNNEASLFSLQYCKIVVQIGESYILETPQRAAIRATEFNPKGEKWLWFSTVMVYTVHYTVYTVLLQYNDGVQWCGITMLGPYDT